MLFLGLIWCLGQPGHAVGTELIFHQDVGGQVLNHTILNDESLVELARHYDLGYNEIIAANPELDPFIPEAGVRAMIPMRWILPDVPKQAGIVINLAEMRLYYFSSRSGKKIETHPVGIGDEGWETPIGTYSIVEKIVNPAWYVPLSIREQKPELPAVMPSGPDNPLGTHALRLSIGTVLIHGTDRPFGIGRRVSHGCIHLYPEDIAHIFSKVRVGTRVTIVRQQVKATCADGRVLVEIHGDGGEGLEQEAVNLLVKKKLFSKVDLGRLRSAVLAQTGMPTDVTVE
jgi:lipoprotein-anchoring transpeptidase ErfK/SrfK